MMRKILLASSALALTVNPAAQAVSGSYSQPADNDVPRQVFWGDTHLHTRISADAYSVGNTTHSPEVAFRFARGETVVAQNGMKVKLRHPLDFLVVSDHAEYLGMLAGAQDGDDAVLSSELGMKLRHLFQRGDMKAFVGALMNRFSTISTIGETADNVEPEVRSSIWQRVAARADRFNAPGRFTAFVGYEYTSMPNMANLHRVVVFQDGAERTSKILPFSALDSKNPEDLWKFMESYEAQTGGSVLAIPHNSNLSDGAMFDQVQYNGDPITVAYARTRIRWEPIHEMTQIKGDSETHPVLSPDDEFADYETWNSWSGGKKLPPGASRPDWERKLPGSYARSALKRGLEIEQQVGVNPYKFGMIGSTDAHTSLSTAEEDNFWGKFGNVNPSAERWSYTWGLSDLPDDTNALSAQVSVSPVNWTTAASGLAAVWARENTREALFDAMRRKEVYATTGSRMSVRFFGGWDYPANADKRPDYVDIGYDGGVPMGGDLMAAQAGKNPTFIVAAAKDPDGANLDRIQIVKGWVDANGKAHERVYDVVWSGDRIKDAKTGRLTPVGMTVDLKTATYTNTIGAPGLSTVWTDPDFEPTLRAFYYVRVIEIPTPRWTAYDAAFFKLDLPANVPQTTQEHAYTSPIWYTP